MNDNIKKRQYKILQAKTKERGEPSCTEYLHQRISGYLEFQSLSIANLVEQNLFVKVFAAYKQVQVDGKAKE